MEMVGYKNIRRFGVTGIRRGQKPIAGRVYRTDGDSFEVFVGGDRKGTEADGDGDDDDDEANRALAGK